ncbi:phage baseplate assembly protein [Herminiimonas contaminans]|uniref:Prophage tail gpP-like protein n=1 Tax=Herminiimonas contaminans TaxID=1111140 RepID=A0ABS0EXU2_9BURK|nr:hypothetical protein [Herminiimonas contaminans]MBF8179664.1 hypothetical protein [Herminiimonas contaminans]
MSEQRIELLIDGYFYSGWKSARVEVGIEQASGAFDLSTMDRWQQEQQSWPIYPGNACQILIAGQQVMNGYVDTARPRISKQAHGIRIVGRDKTMDLIDCSAVHKSGQWKRVKADRIARDICQPFGIEVIVDGDVGAAFDSFNIEMGERAFATIDRAARMRGMLVTTDGTGKLRLTRAGTTRATDSLVEGENIIDAELEHSWKERYSEITVKGQGKGDATTFGAKVAHGVASAKDDVINRYRPLIVIAEQHGSSPTFKQRAEWERNVRRGRSTIANIVVQGWTQKDGSLWRPNTIVSVQTHRLGIDQDLLIARCGYATDEREGSFTHLKVVHPSAFEILDGIKATRLGSRIRGTNGLEDSSVDKDKYQSRNRAKGGGPSGSIIDFRDGQLGGPFR